MNNLLTQALNIQSKSQILLESVEFTCKQIDNLPDSEDDADIKNGELLLARLRNDYIELEKQELEYNQLRTMVNAQTGKELLPSLPPREKIDFNL